MKLISYEEALAQARAEPCETEVGWKSWLLEHPDLATKKLLTNMTCDKLRDTHGWDPDYVEKFRELALRRIEEQEQP